MCCTTNTYQKIPPASWISFRPILSSLFINFGRPSGSWRCYRFAVFSLFLDGRLRWVSWYIHHLGNPFPYWWQLNPSDTVEALQTEAVIWLEKMLIKTYWSSWTLFGISLRHFKSWQVCNDYYLTWILMWCLILNTPTISVITGWYTYAGIIF